MLKRILPVLMAPLLLAGCSTPRITNLTPRQQERNANNLYPVEVALDSRQQTLRWETIRPQIIVGNQAYPMRPTPLMTNRWEGLVPVPANQNWAYYRYHFDYTYNSFGAPRSGTAVSKEFPLRVSDK
jgi:hypothetical protein